MQIYCSGFLVVVFVALHHLSVVAGRKCFSCMSRYYGATWEFAGYERLYLEPRSFSDYCEDPQSRVSDVLPMNCDEDDPPGTNCIMFVEDLKIGTGARGYVRGCWNSIFKWGFNRTGLAGMLKHKDFCQRFNLSQLIAGGKAHESSVLACSCSGHLCNGAASLRSNSANNAHLLASTSDFVMKLWILSAIVLVAAAQECPNYPPWRDWTDTCLWLPLREMHEKMMGACGIGMNLDSLPPVPEFEGMPTEPCGHCSLKMRCRTRPEAEGCFRVEAEKQTCHEHGDVCTFPKIELRDLGCNYRLIKTYFGQCLSRPDLPEWRAEGIKKLQALVGDMNCIEKDDQCKCCCHPYKPSVDGSTCEEQTPPVCESFGDWNDWSKCLWMPLEELQKDVTDHCAFDAWKPTEKHQSMLSKFQLPGGAEPPEKCGYCSFKLKCRKRPFEDSEGKKQCFPIEAEKKVCDSDDCPTCTDVCTLPKVLDSCDYSKTLAKVVGPKVKAVLKKLPYTMHHGLANMLGMMPHTECIEKDGECKCCCHPYKPNAEGTACELNPVCMMPEEHGVDIDWDADKSFF
uniref:Uncharacterized protein n=1 Tax=Plectus sambesii TaxID=2011161 RepID=A0A914UXM8_9BILA